MLGNGQLSSSLPITCGVPQGSILGPLFFITYINDMQNYLDTKDLGLYADDTVLFSHANDDTILQNKLQQTLNKFQKWCNMNALSINIKKTKFMIFGTRSKVTRNVVVTTEKNGFPTVLPLGTISNLKKTPMWHVCPGPFQAYPRADYVLSRVDPFSAFNSVLLTYLSPLAATGCRPPLKCTATIGAPVTACDAPPPHQRDLKQRVGILLCWLIVNRLDNRGYYSRTTFWRGECRYIESPNTTMVALYTTERTAPGRSVPTVHNFPFS